MFCADDSPVQILTADFRYRNGETQTLQVRARVRAGDCSRVIGLRNRNAELASVTFTADPASLDRRRHRTGAGARPLGERPSVPAEDAIAVPRMIEAGIRAG